MYTLTVTAGSASTTLPDEARGRTYASTVVPSGRATSFTAHLSGARFFATAPCPPGRPQETCTYNRIGIGVAGESVNIQVGIIEDLGESAYLILSAVAQGTFGPSGITSPLSGEFQYCRGEPFLIDQGTWTCPSGRGVSCETLDHHLTLIRR